MTQITSIEDLKRSMHQTVYVGFPTINQVDDIPVSWIHIGPDEEGLDTRTSGRFGTGPDKAENPHRYFLADAGIRPYPGGNWNDSSRTFTTREEAEEWAGIKKSRWINVYWHQANENVFSIPHKTREIAKDHIDPVLPGMQYLGTFEIGLPVSCQEPKEKEETPTSQKADALTSQLIREIKQDIERAFDWGRTKQGAEFWVDVYEALEDLENYAQGTY